MTSDIRILKADDEAVLASVAAGVFDNRVDPELARQFLADPHHHIAVAIDNGVVIAFASGVDYIHPDKPRELWINEVSVAPAHRDFGLGKAVTTALLNHARALGCREAWVLSEPDNDAANALYASLGGRAMRRNPRGYEFPLGIANR